MSVPYCGIHTACWLEEKASPIIGLVGAVTAGMDIKPASPSEDPVLKPGIMLRAPKSTVEKAPIEAPVVLNAVLCVNPVTRFTCNDTGGGEAVTVGVRYKMS
uniref:Uncharacterized protein n=1 Tax=Photinus pyralis TaxID=7054 RepID=A0A1Y1MNS7_PHOPY